MICKNCGSEYEQDAQFCPVCGAKPNEVSAQAANGMDSNSTYSLVFGILSLFFSGLLGIIFGAIAISKANAFKREYEVLCGNAQAGRVLGIVGLIVSALAMFAVLAYIVIIALVFSVMGAGELEEIAFSI